MMKNMQSFQTSNNAQKASSYIFRNNNSNVLTQDEFRNQYLVEYFLPRTGKMCSGLLFFYRAVYD